MHYMANSVPLNNKDVSVIESCVSHLCKLWNIKSIEHEIKVEYSSRMTRSLGRTKPTKKLVRLNTNLSSSLSEHLEEVLCHEIAHIAATHKYGDEISPHGKEWQTLVRLAGYEPSIRMNVLTNNIHKPLAKRFAHKCPVCFSEQVAKRRVTRWRCGNCVQAGLTGELVIEEVR